jgi:hydrogenase assembly chaperone HypC/HupF
MCLATPVQVKLKVKNEKLKVIVDGDKTIDISLVPDVKVGDWLLCHGDLAINQIDANEAKIILNMIKSCQHNH